MEPYEYIVIELQYVAGNSNKFYRGYFDKQTGEVTFQYGKNTSNSLLGGNWSDTKTYPSVEQGYEALMKQIRSKVAKGYQTVSTVSILCAKKPHMDQLARLLTMETRYYYTDDDIRPRSTLVLANV